MNSKIIKECFTEVIVKDDEKNHQTSFIQALSRGIEKRFGPVLENEGYLLATAIIPQFKLNFLSDEQKKYLIKEKLLAYIKEMNQELEKSGLFNLYLIANVKRFFFG